MAYGWQIIGPIDGHSSKALDEGHKRGKSGKAQKPSLIILQYPYRLWLAQNRFRSQPRRAAWR